MELPNLLDNTHHPLDHIISPTGVRNGIEVAPDVEEKILAAFEKGWGILVWDDPVNTMDYVAHVFRKVLKMDKESAWRHMMEVHNKGKSLVGVETKERAEFIVHRLQGYSLHATLERI